MFLFVSSRVLALRIKEMLSHNHFQPSPSFGCVNFTSSSQFTPFIMLNHSDVEK